jgi:hypothetical protein
MALTTLKRQSQLDGRAHDLTMVFDDFGITVMSVPPSGAHELPQQLRALLHAHQQQALRWVEIGAYAGPPELAQIGVTFNEPWKPDPHLDALVTQMPSAGAAQGDFDGRAYARELARRARRRPNQTP